MMPMIRVRILTIVLLITYSLYGCSTQEPELHNEEDEHLYYKQIMEKTIDNIESLSSAAEKSRDEVRVEETQKLYDKINADITELIQLVEMQPSNLHIFLKLNGLRRIIMPNIDPAHTSIKYNILILLKTIVKLAPSTSSVMPARMIDELLDAFENDDDMDHKEIIIDILHEWLPENPRGQARVMKVKGLVPFYNQMTKLDVKNLHKMLDLFNKILEEHIEIRYKKPERATLDAETLKIYQRIGLIEHMSRKDVCDGLLDIFGSISLVKEPNYIVLTLLDLSVKVAPFCYKYYVHMPKAERLFDAFLNYFQEENDDEKFLEFNKNTTYIKTFITDYVKRLKEAKDSKDEF